LSPLATAGLAFFILILFAGIYSSLFGLPGTAVIFIDVFLYALISGFDRIGFKIILILLVLSVIAEAMDFLLDVSGALVPIPSKKSFVVSAVGAIIGAFIFTPLLWAAGTFGGFFLGCFAGMLIIEFNRQSKLLTPFKANNRAIFIMIGGKTVKGCIALTMIALSLSNIYS
jgi:uncharacterized protein YqgC (DUF456 family)